MTASFDTLIVGALLLVAAFTDLRTREVPGWLTFGGISSGVAVAAMNGVDALFASLLGTMIGGSIVLPFVLIGAFGAADVLLLAAIGIWTMVAHATLLVMLERKNDAQHRMTE